MQDYLLPLIFVSLGFVIYYVRIYLPWYLRRKAENLAQKEDIAALTEIVQRVQTQFDKAKLIHRVQFEAEFRYYERVWEAADAVHASFVRLYPIAVVQEGSEQPEIIKRFSDAQLEFARVLEISRPFIPKTVWQAFHAFEDHLIAGKVNYNERETGNIRQWRQHTREALERCGEEIRKRLESLLVV